MRRRNRGVLEGTRGAAARSPPAPSVRPRRAPAAEGSAPREQWTQAWGVDHLAHGKRAGLRMPRPHGAATPRGHNYSEEHSMAQQKGSTGQDDPEQRGRMEDARPNE